MEFQRNSAMSAAANDFVTAVLAADRRPAADEWRFRRHRYVKPAQRSGRPSASRVSTRGRPV
jgi:hypothetical protein